MAQKILELVIQRKKVVCLHGWLTKRKDSNLLFFAPSGISNSISFRQLKVRTKFCRELFVSIVLKSTLRLIGQVFACHISTYFVVCSSLLEFGSPF